MEIEYCIVKYRIIEHSIMEGNVYLYSNVRQSNILLPYIPYRIKGNNRIYEKAYIRISIYRETTIYDPETGENRKIQVYGRTYIEAYSGGTTVGVVVQVQQKFPARQKFQPYKIRTGIRK
jgi:hypothetical protein